MIRRSFLKGLAALAAGFAAAPLPRKAAAAVPVPAPAVLPSARPRCILPEPEVIPQPMTPDEIRQLNALVFDKLMSRDQDAVRRAEDAVSAFIRVKMREDGFFRRIVPLVSITNDQLV